MLRRRSIFVNASNTKNIEDIENELVSITIDEYSKKTI